MTQCASQGGGQESPTLPSPPALTCQDLLSRMGCGRNKVQTTAHLSLRIRSARFPSGAQRGASTSLIYPPLRRLRAWPDSVYLGRPGGKWAVGISGWATGGCGQEDRAVVSGRRTGARSLAGASRAWAAVPEACSVLSPSPPAHRRQEGTAVGLEHGRSLLLIRKDFHVFFPPRDLGWRRTQGGSWGTPLAKSPRRHHSSSVRGSRPGAGLRHIRLYNLSSRGSSHTCRVSCHPPEGLQEVGYMKPAPILPLHLARVLPGLIGSV